MTRPLSGSELTVGPSEDGRLHGPRASRARLSGRTAWGALALVLLAAVATVRSHAGDVARGIPARAQGADPVDPAELSVSVERLGACCRRGVALVNAGDGSGRLFAAEKTGRVWVYADGERLPAPFLDITDRVNARSNEQGLLGLAFHPDFPDVPYFYVNYTTSKNLSDLRLGSGDTVVARFTAVGDGMASADPESEVFVIGYDQPYGNHNGGDLRFGPDGYLYIGSGDGGSGGDPENRAQDGGSLLGKMLRIDVNVDAGAPAPYAIPADNPFVGRAGFREEIWALGLRNPWRYAFDAATGDLYIADVGQNAWEEVDFQPADSPGGENYGWRVMEGNHCFNPSSGCDREGKVTPVAEYPRSEGQSITGGEVYRGAAFPRFVGTYFYADYVTGNVWGLNRDPEGEWRSAKVGSFDFRPTTFGVDEAGELFVLSDNDTYLYRVVDPDAEPAEPTATMVATEPALTPETPGPGPSDTPTAEPTIAVTDVPTDEPPETPAGPVGGSAHLPWAENPR